MSLMASFRLPPVSSPQWAAPSEQSQNGVMGHSKLRLNVKSIIQLRLGGIRSFDHSIYLFRVEEFSSDVCFVICICLKKNIFSLAIGYRNWYQDWGHCGVTNDLGSSPQPEGEARGLWWASQVVGDTTMTEIEVSISILSWCPKAY